MTAIYNLGEYDLNDYYQIPRDRYQWFVYVYHPMPYAGDGLAISYDGEHLRSHQLCHGTHGLLDELACGDIITEADLDSDHVLDPEFSPLVVKTVKALLSGDRRTNGPRVSLDLTCFHCVHCQTVGYTCQGDSGTDVYCTHPESLEEGQDRRFIGDSRWSTPRWCQLRQSAIDKWIGERATK